MSVGPNLLRDLIYIAVQHMLRHDEAIPTPWRRLPRSLALQHFFGWGD